MYVYVSPPSFPAGAIRQYESDVMSSDVLKELFTVNGTLKEV